MTASGERLRLLSMTDPDALPVGSTGTVRRVLNEGRPDLEQVDVAWDPPHAHRSLMLIPGVDTWEILGALPIEDGPDARWLGCKCPPDNPGPHVRGCPWDLGRSASSA